MTTPRSTTWMYLLVLVFLSLAATARADISAVSVSLNVSTVNNPAQYTLGFTTGGAGALTTSDTIIATFPLNTTVPSIFPGGAGAQVTVNGNTTSASGIGQTLTINVPTSIGSGAAVTVIITTGATNIINPSTPGATYQAGVSTSIEPTVVNSGNYIIGPSATALSVGSVTVTPNTISNVGQYSFNITTSADGALVAGSSIVVTFPVDTTVPTTFTAGDITVGGTAVVTASGSGQVVTITSPTALNASTAYAIAFATNAGIVNPGAVNTYALTASTTAQTAAGTSPAYSIGVSATPLTVVAVTVTPNTISNVGQYGFGITTSADGAQVAGSTIVVTFPVDTTVPTTFAAGDITIGGASVITASGTGQAATITSPIALNASTSYSIVFTTNAGIVNPGTVNTYTLTASTAVQTAAGTSPAYNIGLSLTPVNIDYVIPNPNTIGNQASYSIRIDIASDGALIGGVSTITLTFPVGTLVQNGAVAGITVGGTGAFSAVGNAGTRTVVIVPNQNISGGTNNRTIVIPSSALRNPTSVNTYTLTVSTSVQPAGTSPGYSIGQSSTNVNVSSVTPSPSTIGQPASYTIAFMTSSDGALLSGVSTVTIDFPADTTISNGVFTGILVNGTPATGSGVSASRRVVVTIPSDIAGSTAVTVFLPSAYLFNPSSASNYALNVATSVQPPGTSPLYSIGSSSTPVNIDSVTPTPAIIGNPAQYNVQIDLSADGGLAGGTGTIILTFPADTLVQNGAVAGVTVEGTGAFSAVGNTGARTITVVPNQDLAGGINDVNIIIPSTALRNPTTVNTYALTVTTSVQPAGTSPSYLIGLSSTPINVSSATPNPSTIGNQAQYDIQFDLASDGTLIGGLSTITLTFPANTLVTNGAITGVTVEGIGADSATGNSGTRTITVVPNQDLSGSTSNINLIIPSPGVRNPTSVNTYALTVETSVQPAGSSLSYSITTSATTVNVTSVVPNPGTVGNNAQYSIDFNTSADGALLGSVSQIIITFPVDTMVSNGVISGILVQGAGASASGSTSTRTVTITAPQNISGSASVSVTIPAAAVRNPTSVASYSLTVATSLQPAGLSPLYAIGQSSTVVIITSVVPSPNYISQNAVYAINFDTSADGALAGGLSQITVIFPADTAITNGPLSGVTVNGIPVTSATGNSGSRLIDLVPAQDISGNTTGITISLPATAVQNPSTPASYTLTVATSAQPTGLSPAFNITLVPTPTPTATITLTITVTSTVTVSPTMTPSVAPLAANTAFTYPSPARGETAWFYYSVNGMSDVRIEIYNILGEKGEVLTNTHASAGNQRTRWDLREVAPGIYFYRIIIQEAGRQRDFGIKKIAVIK